MLKSCPSKEKPELQSRSSAFSAASAWSGVSVSLSKKGEMDESLDLSTTDFHYSYHVQQIFFNNFFFTCCMSLRIFSRTLNEQAFKNYFHLFHTGEWVSATPHSVMPNYSDFLILHSAELFGEFSIILIYSTHMDLMHGICSQKTRNWIKRQR